MLLLSMFRVSRTKILSIPQRDEVSIASAASFVPCFFPAPSRLRARPLHPSHCWECRIAFVVSCIGSFFGWQTLAQCIIGRLGCYFLRCLLMAQCRDRSAREIGAGGPGFSGSFRFSKTTSLRRAPYRRDSPQPAYCALVGKMTQRGRCCTGHDGRNGSRLCENA